MVRIIAGVVVAALLVLVAAQLVLPPLAERRLRGELADTGSVRSVQVEAFPAVKLLARRADAVRVRLDRLAAGPTRIGDYVERASGVEALDVRAATGTLGPLEVRDLVFRKRGRALTGEASVTEAAIAAVLPPSVGLELQGAEAGQLRLRATVGPVGVDARVAAEDGRIVVAAEGLLGALASTTVFDDPRVRVTSVGARSAGPGAYRLTARASAEEPP